MGLLTVVFCRYIPWPHLLPLFRGLARLRRLSNGVLGHWRDPAGLPPDCHPDVHLREEGPHVDG